MEIYRNKHTQRKKNVITTSSEGCVNPHAPVYNLMYSLPSNSFIGLSLHFFARDYVRQTFKSLPPKLSLSSDLHTYPLVHDIATYIILLLPNNWHSSGSDLFTKMTKSRKFTTYWYLNLKNWRRVNFKRFFFHSCIKILFFGRNSNFDWFLCADFMIKWDF